MRGKGLLELCNALLEKKMFSPCTYTSSRLVIVEVHSGSGILPRLQSIDKLFRNPFPKFNIITASSPNPASTTYTKKINADTSAIKSIEIPTVSYFRYPGD